jgi:hypothetical protein
MKDFRDQIRAFNYKKGTSLNVSQNGKSGDGTSSGDEKRQSKTTDAFKFASKKLAV